MPEENILAVGLVSAEITEKHGRRAAYGAQVTLEARLPRVALSALRTYKDGLAHVLPDFLGLQRGWTESYKLDTRMLEWSKVTFDRRVRLAFSDKSRRNVWGTQRDTMLVSRCTQCECRIDRGIRICIAYTCNEISEMKNKIFTLPPVFFQRG